MNNEFENAFEALFCPSDPLFNLEYARNTFQVKVKGKGPVSELYVCQEPAVNTHKYGVLFAHAPQLYRCARKALIAHQTVTYLLDKKCPEWRQSFLFEKTYQYINNTLVEIDENYKESL